MDSIYPESLLEKQSKENTCRFQLNNNLPLLKGHTRKVVLVYSHAKPLNYVIRLRTNQLGRIMKVHTNELPERLIAVSTPPIQKCCLDSIAGLVLDLVLLRSRLLIQLAKQEPVVWGGMDIGVKRPSL